MNQRAPRSGASQQTVPSDPHTSEAQETADEARAQGREVADTARTQGKEVAETARDEGRGTADTAREEARDLFDTTRGETREVVETAREQAGDVLDEAATQVKAVADDVVHQLHDQADAQTHRAAQTLHTSGQQLRALADGRPEDAGPMDDYARRAAGQVERVAGRVDEMGFDGLVDEVQGFARRRPGAFLAGAAAAGFLVGRVARNRGEDDPQPAGGGR